MTTVMKEKEDSDKEVEVKLPVLTPHAVLEYLFRESKLKIPEAALRAYWDHAKRFCEWVQEESFDSSHIPVAIYRDTARYGQGYNQSKITGCFMSLVLWRPRSTRLSQWLFFSVDADLTLGHKTWNPLYRVVVDSLNAAFHGLTLEGHALSNKLCCTEVKGDCEFHWQTLRMSRYWKTRYLCWRCDAENHASASHCYLDFGENPTWQSARISHNAFVINICKPDHV